MASSTPIHQMWLYIQLGLLAPQNKIKGAVGKNKLIDDSKYFIIAIDALANGVSTSPSNSELQSGKSFPKITIEDMVNTQYKNAYRTFGIKAHFRNSWWLHGQYASLAMDCLLSRFY